jgi:uncharacterized membrane protein YphA (DoxX/SURF4 family)
MLSDRDNVAGVDTALLIARIALAAIFLYSGYGKLTNPAGFSGVSCQSRLSGGASYPLALVAGLTKHWAVWRCLPDFRRDTPRWGSRFSRSLRL